MAGKGKILVVDDDRLVLATVSHGLAQAGYDPQLAALSETVLLAARPARGHLARRRTPQARAESRLKRGRAVAGPAGRIFT